LDKHLKIHCPSNSYSHPVTYRSVSSRLLRRRLSSVRSEISKYINSVLGIVNTGDVYVRAGEGDVTDVEEKKSRLRGVGLDGFGGEIARIRFRRALSG